jgi:hypothetical protein
LDDQGVGGKMGSEWILGRLAWGGCRLDSTGSGQGPVAGCYERDDEPSGSCATELVMRLYKLSSGIVLGILYLFFRLLKYVLYAFSYCAFIFICCEKKI